METDVTERIDTYWSRFLGVSVSALHDPGFVVTEHARLRGYRGVWFFARGHSIVISSPPDWVARLERYSGAYLEREPVSENFARRVLGSAIATIVGPSFQGWLRPDRFRAVPSNEVERLVTNRLSRVQAFRASCSPAEWEHGGIDPERGEIRACVREAELVALGQLRAHLDEAVDPCVITRPDHRGRGHASELVSALVQEALSSRQLVLYQTVLSNTSAVSIARRLGFEQYATLLAARLAPDSAA